MISDNTKAILLLSSPLRGGGGDRRIPVLTHGEYKRLARHLREINRQPSDLLSSKADELCQACSTIVDKTRLLSLLHRGFVLSQAIEQWSARAIWVVSRADAAYPRIIKHRLREDAPAILYGCGNIALLEMGGLAVVGSRNVREDLIDYTKAIGHLAANAGVSIISGGARGVDQAAVHASVAAGGRACSMLADGLENAALSRSNRDGLMQGNLVLISPYDPGSGFSVGNAMQRNKLIYALADAALVVHADLGKGGTWSGAIEQLSRLRFVPVYVRSTGVAAPALDALIVQGARPWPNPHTSEALERIIAESRDDVDDVDVDVDDARLYAGDRSL